MRVLHLDYDLVLWKHAWNKTREELQAEYGKKFIKSAVTVLAGGAIAYYVADKSFTSGIASWAFAVVGGIFTAILGFAWNLGKAGAEIYTEQRDRIESNGSRPGLPNSEAVREWGWIRLRFEEIADKRINASRYMAEDGPHWTINADISKEGRKARTCCQTAGKLLLKTECAWQLIEKDYADQVRKATDDSDRWLLYLAALEYMESANTDVSAATACLASEYLRLPDLVDLSSDACSRCLTACS